MSEKTTWTVTRNHEPGRAFRYTAYRGGPVLGVYLGGTFTLRGARWLIRKDRKRVASGLPTQAVVWTETETGQ